MNTGINRKFAFHVVKTLQDRGFTAVFAGGCVRDEFLGVAPHDYDVATSASPDVVEDIFAGHTVPVGKSFGVVLVTDGPGNVVEVATFRRDGRYLDGRRPDDVELLTKCDPVEAMKADSARRDFTINSMFLDPVANKVYDFQGGELDITARVLRFVGDARERLEEDHLRALRFVRFTSRLPQFTPDIVAMHAVSTDIRDKNVVIAPERVAQEFIGTITSPHVYGTMVNLVSFGVFERYLPEVHALNGLAQEPMWHPEGDAFVHTTRVVANVPADDIVLRFAALLHDIGKATTTVVEDGKIKSKGHDEAGAVLARARLEQLKFSRNFIDSVVWLIENHMHAYNVPEMRRGRVRRFMDHPDIDRLAKLHRADKLGGNGDTTTCDKFDAALKEVREYGAMPKPFVNGKDLIQMGFNGRDIGVAKDELYTMQLESVFSDRLGALAAAQVMANKRLIEG